jgi:heptose-I-phosphate ethanolaminephosphotransferase
MNGSHFVYSRRYPETFARFHHAQPTYRDELVDGYDNSILYTDWLLNEIIAALAGSHRPAALVYASDHGENLLDDKAMLVGHGIGTAYDLHPAAFFWVSDALCRNRGDMCKNAVEHARARLSASNLPHSLLDLAGIQIPQLDHSQSVFSTTFTERERWYVTRGRLSHENRQLAAR